MPLASDSTLALAQAALGSISDERLGRELIDCTAYLTRLVRAHSFTVEIFP